jgi:hypothetical protein
LEFKGFKWAGNFERVPNRTTSDSHRTRRAAPRYNSHLPATIRLVGKGKNKEPTFSAAVLGHCQTISSIGMALSFVGSRFNPDEFARPGRLLLVVISLPGGAVETLVKTVTHERIKNSDGPANWFVGASIVQISEADRSQLSAYLDKRSRDTPLAN